MNVTLSECRWPAEFPAFVQHQVETGAKVRELLEAPHKWEREFLRFVCGVNCEVIGNQPIEDWLYDNCWVDAKQHNSGMGDTLKTWREIESGPTSSGRVGNLVGDFTNYDEGGWEQPPLVTGAIYQFRAWLIYGVIYGGEQWMQATAHVEHKHGLRIVVFELEAVR